MTVCPSCGAAVPVADLDTLIRDREITGASAAILRALWAARGRSLGAWVLFDAIYADDPDSGPGAGGTMYRDLKRGLADLRAALAGAGVSIEQTHPRKLECRLVITGF